MSFPATAHRQCLLAFFFAALALVLAPTSARAAANPNEVQTAWRLLDYIAVDYDGAVSDGRITSPSEYAEMTEFSASAAAKIAALPANPQRQELVDGVARLQRLIADKAPKQDVAQAGHGLAAALLAAYPVPLAPANAPSFARGKALYAQNCAACHGIAGDGHGPNAASLSTPPIAFTDRARAEQRSIFALYQVITQGIDGTAMPSCENADSATPYQRSAFHAATKPIGRASTSASANDSSVSGTVTDRRAAISGPTGRELMNDCPRSSVRRLPNHEKNCGSSGWSLPTWRCAAAICSLVAPTESRALDGSRAH